MTHQEDLKPKENITSKQVQFVNAFAHIAKKAINEYHNNNTDEQEMKVVKIPNQTKENLQ